MDADGAFDEQHVRRTAKSCGSDAPTLASSWRKYFRWRRWQTSPVTGKSTKETVKTIARGMPGVSGVTVVTMLVCFFYFACEAAGASRARHSLRPLCFGADDSCITRAHRVARSWRCVQLPLPSLRGAKATKQSIFDLAMPSDGLLRLRSQ